MQAIAVVKWVFTAVGLVLLAGAALLYLNTRTFIASAIEAEGTVLELLPVRSSDSTTWRPVIRFEDQSGTTVEFSTSWSSSPPPFEPGEKVTVLYPPGRPHDARVRQYFSLWGAATILGALGGVFLSVGGGIMLFTWLKRSRAAALRESGTPIETDLLEVERNTAVRVNGRCPFRVVAQWQNPATGEIHLFRSDNIWFDPARYLTSPRITVYIDRANPKRYHVDLSFLPKLAG